MKIAFFCDTYIPTKNGVVTSVCTTAEELRSRGHRVVIFAPRYAHHEEHDPNVVRFAAGHWFKARDYPVAWPFASRVAPRAAIRFRRERFDIVHVHSPFVLGNIGAHWAKFHFLPLVWTFHTLYHHYAHYSITSPRSARWYILWRVRRMLEKCDRVLVPSCIVERVVQKLLPGTPTRVLPTGVDVEKFANGDRQGTRQRLGIAQNEVALLYVGRMAHEKNLGFMLRAIAPVLANRPAKLIMVGGGPWLQTCRDLTSKLGVRDRVVFTDFIEPSAIADYYAAGDAFTFASRTETQGLSIAEALCAGLPCIVVNAMGVVETIEPEGDSILVPAQESRFREAVQRLVDDSELRHRMSARALERAPLFAKDHRITELIQHYEEVIEANALRNEQEHFELV